MNMRCYSIIFAGAALISAWLLPNHYPPWQSMGQEYLAFCALFLVLFPSAATRSSMQLPVIGAAFAALATIPVLQAIGGLLYFSGDGWVSTIYLISFSLAVASGHHLCQVRDAKSVATAFAIVTLTAAVVAAAIATYQWLSLSGLGIYAADLKPGGRPHGNLAQPNNHASLLWLGLVSALYLYSRRRVGAVVMTVLALYLTFAIAMSQSRTSWLCASLLLIGWLWQGRYVMRVHGAALLTGVAAYVGLVMLWPLIVELVGAVGNDEIRSAEVGVRRLMWLQMFDAALQKPWLGWGWNQVSVAQVAVAVDHPPVNYTEHSHNLLIDLLVWNGLVVGGLAIAFLLWWGVTRAYAARSQESVFAMLAIGGLFMHAMLEFPLEYAYFLLPVGFLMGLVDADQQRKTLFTLPRYGLWVILATGLLLATLVWFEYRQVEADHRLMRFENARIGSLQAEKIAPDIVMLSHLREFLRFARTEADADMSADEIEWMEHVAHRYAYPPALFRHALALGLNHQPEAAALEMRRLEKLHGEVHYSEGISALRELAGTKYPDLAATLVLLETAGE